VQIPAVTSVTVAAFAVLETVQTDEVFEAKATIRLDVALAVTVKAGVPNGLSVRAAKVMV
jgi:hypothetical protein